MTDLVPRQIELSPISEAHVSCFFEDFSLGTVFTSPSMEVGEDLIVEFARIYDPQYFHLDPERARDSVFGGLVAGGFQTAALAWGLALRTGLFRDCALAGLGIDGLRWHTPLRAGDVVHTRFWLIKGRLSSTRPGAGVATFQYEVRNQLDELLLTLQLAQLLRCRPE